SVHDDRWLTYPWGVNGGEPGMRSTKRLVRVDGSEENIPSKCDRVKVFPGDILYFNTWGGGGWGNPLDRDPALVMTDVERGLVTVDGATRYGVVVKSGAVDTTATKALRDKMAPAQTKIPLFSRGFDSIEELKNRCREETGFEPPAAPVFQSAFQRAAE
ncbi:MAG: hydantoinase B/oxoprolinase family protein, partial [Pseudomonadota bacterium]